jgi:hypothetical protein
VENRTSVVGSVVANLNMNGFGRDSADKRRQLMSENAVSLTFFLSNNKIGETNGKRTRATQIDRARIVTTGDAEWDSW